MLENNKKFRVIEEGVMNLTEMASLLGGDQCNVVTTCNPKFHDCRPNNTTCGCYNRLYSITGCVNIYGTCGIVEGCGGRPGSDPYSVTKPRP